MIIAERTLRLVSGKHAGAIVTVRIHLPEKMADHWACSYEIGWPEGTRISSGFGIDGVQAITLALQKIGTELYMSQHHHDRSLAFEEPGQGYGFPVHKPLRDILIGDDAAADGI